ncbi:MAG: hypothetical protein LBK95_20550 [Bifidobacteriaceae bacterium]|jgi:hypothetical protein|nr:hypothetical protein [Bifidobacteriaceae bacterium]
MNARKSTRVGAIMAACMLVAASLAGCDSTPETAKSPEATRAKEIDVSVKVGQEARLTALDDCRDADDTRWALGDQEGGGRISYDHQRGPEIRVTGVQAGTVVIEASGGCTEPKRFRVMIEGERVEPTPIPGPLTLSTMAGDELSKVMEFLLQTDQEIEAWASLPLSEARRLSDQEIEWGSSNPAVVSLEGEARTSQETDVPRGDRATFRAVGAGNAQITARLGDVTSMQEIDVTVVAAPVDANTLLSLRSARIAFEAEHPNGRDRTEQGVGWGPELRQVEVSQIGSAPTGKLAIVVYEPTGESCLRMDRGTTLDIDRMLQYPDRFPSALAEVQFLVEVDFTTRRGPKYMGLTGNLNSAEIGATITTRDLTTGQSIGGSPDTLWGILDLTIQVDPDDARICGPYPDWEDAVDQLIAELP